MARSLSMSAGLVKNPSQSLTSALARVVSPPSLVNITTRVTFRSSALSNCFTRSVPRTPGICWSTKTTSYGLAWQFATSPSALSGEDRHVTSATGQIAVILADKSKASYSWSSTMRIYKEASLDQIDGHLGQSLGTAMVNETLTQRPLP